jgi:hypothetical protein
MYVTFLFPLQRDSEARAARNLDFCRLLLIFWNLEQNRLVEYSGENQKGYFSCRASPYMKRLLRIKKTMIVVSRLFHKSGFRFAFHAYTHET